MSGKRIRRPSVISSAKPRETEQSKLIASHFTTRYMLRPLKVAPSGDLDSTETKASFYTPSQFRARQSTANRRRGAPCGRPVTGRHEACPYAARNGGRAENLRSC